MYRFALGIASGKEGVARRTALLGGQCSVTRDGLVKKEEDGKRDAWCRREITVQ